MLPRRQKTAARFLVQRVQRQVYDVNIKWAVRSVWLASPKLPQSLMRSEAVPGELCAGERCDVRNYNCGTGINAFSNKDTNIMALAMDNTGMYQNLQNVNWFYMTDGQPPNASMYTSSMSDPWASTINVNGTVNSNGMSSLFKTYARQPDPWGSAGMGTMASMQQVYT